MLNFQPEISFQRHNSLRPSYLKFDITENGENAGCPLEAQEPEMILERRSTSIYA
jgi:hypothetical protein